MIGIGTICRGATIVAALGVGACTTTQTATNNADAGFVVASVNVAPQQKAYSLLYRSTDGKISGQLAFHRESSFASAAGTEGSVAMARLPAGNYEIYDYRIRTLGIDEETMLHAASEVSLPFTVKAGETTYVGAFRLASLEHSTNGAGPSVLVADRSERDLAIAHAKGAKGSATLALPDPDKFAHVDLR